MIYEAFPEAVKAPSKDKELPLHFAIFRNPSIDVIKMLYEAYPKALEMQNDDGYLPLHYACCRDASNEDSEACRLKILDLLLTANPGSLDIQVKDGKLPRDILLEHTSGETNCVSEAIVMNLSKHVVKLLLQTSPDSCTKQDKEGKIPLHYACSNNTLLFAEFVILLLETNSDCLKIKDHQGTVPAELLCQRFSKANKNGVFPLHQIASGSAGMSAKVLHLLVNAFPKGIASPDKNGLLPFHRAALNPLSSVEVLFLFIKLLPEIVCMSDYSKNYEDSIASQEKNPAKRLRHN
jgi:ankyrin repeat protein